LLQSYETKIRNQFTIIDGNFQQSRSLFDELSKSNPDFNSGQYRVEHGPNKNIVVKPSAGTGKTTVMIDRIMYLLHAKDANLSEIAMITFTNNATNQMSRRVQNQKRLLMKNLNKKL
jgi:ATP-dependent exoDNAse (exonuclease V) beta subunit